MPQAKGITVALSASKAVNIYREQYLTNLVLVSTGIDKASSITTNTIPVSSRYHHDTVLAAFRPSGIVAVLILAIFTKPLMLRTNNR
jgi:hypothetical protein